MTDSENLDKAPTSVRAAILRKGDKQTMDIDDSKGGTKRRSDGGDSTRTEEVREEVYEDKPLALLDSDMQPSDIHFEQTDESMCAEAEGVSNISMKHPSPKMSATEIAPEDQHWRNIGSGIFAKTFRGAKKSMT